MSFEMIIAIFVLAIVLAAITYFISKLIKRRRRSTAFRKKWKEIQKLCANKEEWGEAIVASDELLGKALKRKNYKGKNVGERMVAAQKIFSDNQAVWDAHKLSSKLKDHPSLKLRKTDVKTALLAFGRALKDLGVL